MYSTCIIGIPQPSLQAGQPSYPVVTADSGPRNKKHTLQRRFNPAVASYMSRDGMIADATSVGKDIHTSAVADSIQVRGARYACKWRWRCSS